MSDLRTSNPVAACREVLQAVDARLHRGGIPIEVVEDLKSEVDELRLKLWARLSAAQRTDGEAVLIRFRLRRASEICRNLVADLATEPPGANQRELLQLLEISSQLVARITQIVRGTG